MEACNSEIRISFSLPELDLIRRAVERFGRVEAEGGPSLIRTDHAQHLNRVLNKIVPIHSMVKGETAPPKSRQRAQKAKRSMDTAPFGGYFVSRGELEKIL